MANMSYCRFQNTRIDLRECIDALEEGSVLSDEELIACNLMFMNVLDYFADNGIVDVDWCEYDNWLETIRNNK